MKHILIITVFILFIPLASAQKKMTLTLEDVIHLTQAQSLQSFLIKNYYLGDYWQYRSFKANYLPSISLTSKLFSYNNSSSLRYNSNSKSEEFVRTENLSSDATLSVNQKVGFTGGTLYLNSDLGRIQNYGDEGYVQFSSKPVRLGYSQNLFGFNALKWERKLEPVKFEQAQKEYVQSVESMNIMAISNFFQFVLAKQHTKTAEYNYYQTDTLLQIAQKRFVLGSITKDELLDLKLNKNNNSIRLQEAKLNLRKTKESLLSFLMLPKELEINIVLPNQIPQLQINAQVALNEALKNNPEMLKNEISIAVAEKDVAKTKADNRFSANLGVNVGLTKNDGSYDYAKKAASDGALKEVYKSKFDEYQVVNVNVNVPILDWGRGKGYYQMAKSKQQIAEIAAQQALQQFEQNAVTQVLEFNLQKEKVASAALSDTLASESYALTITRFRRGTADVLKLVSSQNAKDNAVVKYISALSQYWYSYFGIRKLTLFDFQQNKPIEVDFDELVNTPKN